MKNVVLMLLVCVGILVVGCGRKPEVADPGLRGEWAVVSTNCPEVLAEKSGVRRVFWFSLPGNPSLSHTAMRTQAECSKVGPGWTIHVESRRDYSFFPPMPKGKEVK